MRNDLGLQTKLANGFAVLAALLRGGRRGELNAIDTKVVQSFGNLDLRLRVEEGIRKLFALYSVSFLMHVPRRVDSMILKLDTLLRKSA